MEINFRDLQKLNSKLNFRKLTFKIVGKNYFKKYFLIF